MLRTIYLNESSDYYSPIIQTASKLLWIISKLYELFEQSYYPNYS